MLAWLLLRRCRCGHLAAAHEHYRAGRECSLCDCPRYDGRWI